jgi:hypothetical protein
MRGLKLAQSGHPDCIQKHSESKRHYVAKRGANLAAFFVDGNRFCKLLQAVTLHVCIKMTAFARRHVGT